MNSLKIPIRRNRELGVLAKLSPAIILAFVVSLSACKGKDEIDGSSSSNSSSSTSSSSSSSSSGSGNTLDGSVLYSANCSTCHGSNGNGTTKLNLQDYSSQATLAAYIEDYMPKGNTSTCDKECSEAVTRYIWDWRPQETACTSNNDEEPLPRQLRLLTPFEYQNTVNDLFEFTIEVTSNFPITDPVGGYDNNAQASAVSESHASKYWESAGALAFSDKFNFLDHVYCGDSESASVCANKFLDDFGKRAFRRPLTSAETATYSDLWGTASDHQTGARLTVQALLMSPNFLYRPELGANGSLSEYEIASLLSYTFWGSMPDQGLFDAVQYNDLQSQSQIQQQTERLISSDKAKARMAQFGRQWLGADKMVQSNKDSNIYPAFTDQVKSALDTELEMFLADAFLNDEARFADLYLADYVYANNTLASFYGLNGATNSFQKIPAGVSRGGILELGAVLASHAQFNQTSPIKRGVFVRERLLCQELPPPPPGLNADPPILDLSKSTRERFAIHTDNESCATCHQYIDDIGFSFEKYDGIGQFRDTENGINVDDSGLLKGLVNRTDFDEHPYHGTGELADMLGNADTSAECLVEQFHIYMGGSIEPDPCTVENTFNRWKDADLTIKKLWLEAVNSSSFIKRK